MSLISDPHAPGFYEEIWGKKSWRTSFQSDRNMIPIMEIEL